MNYALLRNDEKSIELIDIVEFDDCKMVYIDKYLFYDDGGLRTVSAQKEISHDESIGEHELYEMYEISKVYYNYLIDNTHEMERLVRQHDRKRS